MSKVKEEIVEELKQKGLFKEVFTREEAHLVTDTLRYEIGSVAIKLYEEKVEKITRTKVISGEISYNPRHVVRALVEKNVLAQQDYDFFKDIEDEQFYKFVFSKVDNYEEALDKIINSVADLIILIINKLEKSE